ncbi:MAG: phospho-N-acetylmuramoyl-pentapeptide-transferase [Candidatus Goldiibacteriota bacterium]
MFYHVIYPLYEYMSVLNVFRYITVRSAFAAITAFVLTLIIGDFVIKKLKKMKINQVIRKEGPKKHRIKQGTPTMGGIMILFSFIISIALWGRFDNSYVWIVIMAAVLFAGIGFIDDYMKLKVGTRGMPGKIKLTLQFLSAFAVIGVFIYFSGTKIEGITNVDIPFIKDPFYLPMWLYVIFTALVIAGWSNAVNLTDGLDGLATGLSLFVFVTLVIMAYIIGNVNMSEYLLITHILQSSELTVVCAAFVGALLGFLWFNSYPAQVFMGDVGALMLGGVIGTIAILIKQEILLLIVGMIFVVEVLSVILQVTSYKMTKKRIFKMAPLHHHYQLKGISEPKIIMRFWIVAIIVLLFTLSTLKLR